MCVLPHVTAETLRGCVGAVALGVSLGASAQTEFADDFETCDLSRWNGPEYGASCADAGCQFTADTAAAHRGSCGAHLFDTDGATGSDTETDVWHDAASGSATYYARVWFRLMSSSSAGNFELLVIKAWNPSADYEMAFAGADVNGNAWFLGGHDVSSATAVEQPFGGPLDSSWHLLELGVTGAGGTGATRVVWLDGQRMMSQGSLDWTGHLGGGADLGESWSDDLRYMGQIAFDDLRTSTLPPASRFTVTPGASTVPIGTCAPVDVGLTDSDNAAARAAPYAFSAAMSSGAMGTFASDAQCFSTTTSATFAQRATTTRVYFSPSSPGPIVLTASYVDFLDGTATITASTPSDGGPLSDAGAAADGGAGGNPFAMIVPSSSTVAAGSAVVFDASGSAAAPGSHIVSWNWQEVEGPTGLVLSQDQDRQDLTLADPGVYALTLQVVDDSGRGSNVASAQITVTGSTYRPPRSLGGCTCGDSSATTLWLAGLACLLDRVRAVRGRMQRPRRRSRM